MGWCRHRPRESPVSVPHYGRRQSEVTKRLKRDWGGGWWGGRIKGQILPTSDKGCGAAVIPWEEGPELVTRGGHAYECGRLSV